MQENSPLLIFGTRHSTLYNLTPSNLPSSIHSIQVAYGHLHDYKQTFSNLPQGMTVKKFLGYPQNYLICLTPYDFSNQNCMVGCQNNNKVKIKTNKGYTEITAEDYDEMIELIQPDMFVGLTEYPSLEKDHSSQSNKSLKRAICKTKNFLQKSKFTQWDEKESKPIRLAAVHGGKNLSLLNRSLEQILDHSVDGLVVCDICEQQTFEERQQIFRTLQNRLQQQYKRQKSPYFKKKLKLCLSGKGKLEDIEHGLRFGFEMFEVHYPFLAAEKQRALIYEEGKIVEKIPQKLDKLCPLEQNCKCEACRSYSQSYICHLIECFQLTGKILLSIHNLHKYEQLMQMKQ